MSFHTWRKLTQVCHFARMQSQTKDLISTTYQFLESVNSYRQDEQERMLAANHPMTSLEFFTTWSMRRVKRFFQTKIDRNPCQKCVIKMCIVKSIWWLIMLWHGRKDCIEKLSSSGSLFYPFIKYHTFLSKISKKLLCWQDLPLKTFSQTKMDPWNT